MGFSDDLDGTLGTASFIFFEVYLFIFESERERICVHGGGEVWQRQRERENPKRALRWHCRA